MLISVQEAKASRKFGVLRSFRYESNRNRLFYKNSLALSLAERSKIAITF